MWNSLIVSQQGAFGCSATIVAETVIQVLQLEAAVYRYKNALNKCHVYIMVHIKLYFGGIASPEGGVH